MPKGCRISVEVQEIVVRMSSIFNKEDIAVYTGVSVRSIERILHHFKTHGMVKGRKQGEELVPRRRRLRDIDVEVSIGHLNAAVLY
jgi:hypothetical protein